jgi:hypothetical protein
MSSPFPRLVFAEPGSSAAPRVGHRLVDGYLELVSARLRPNSTLAIAYRPQVRVRTRRVLRSVVGCGWWDAFGLWGAPDGDGHVSVHRHRGLDAAMGTGRRGDVGGARRP